MNKNLILGAATGYKYSQVKPFIKSLRRTNFQGDVCLLVNENLSDEDQRKFFEDKVTLVFLKTYLNFIPKSILQKRFSRKIAFLQRIYPTLADIIFSVDAKFSTALKARFSCVFQHIACSRYSWFYLFLSDKSEKYEKVLLSDVRDVVFQSDPFTSEFDGSLICALEDARKTIASDWGNSNWISSSFGEEELKKIAHHRISCSGTTLGDYSQIMKYLTEMIHHLSIINHKIAGFDGYDQGVHNYLIWNNYFSDVKLLENGSSPILSMHGMPTSEINIDRDGIIRNHDGSIIPVLHQYDRHPQLNLAALCNLGN